MSPCFEAFRYSVISEPFLLQSATFFLAILHELMIWGFRFVLRQHRQLRWCWEALCTHSCKVWRLLCRHRSLLHQFWAHFFRWLCNFILVGCQPWHGHINWETLVNMCSPLSPTRGLIWTNWVKSIWRLAIALVNHAASGWLGYVEKEGNFAHRLMKLDGPWTLLLQIFKSVVWLAYRSCACHS